MRISYLFRLINLIIILKVIIFSYISLIFVSIICYFNQLNLKSANISNIDYLRIYLLEMHFSSNITFDFDNLVPLSSINKGKVIPPASTRKVFLIY